MSDYGKAIEIAERLRVKGTPIGAIDILIAAMVINRKKKLLTKDKDFLKIKDIYDDFIVDILKEN